jgi:hypothetical protein
MLFDMHPNRFIHLELNESSKHPRRPGCGDPWGP